MKTRVLLCLGALILAAWAAWNWFAPHGQTVEIVQDGTVTATLDLSRERKTRTLTLRAHGGGFNTLLIENGRVRVESADCPGNDCVRMGWLRSAAAPLVCLPHRLVVRFAAGAADELDGVVQ